MRVPIRTDKSVLGRWWRSVDRWTLAALLVLSLFGVVLVSAASPSVAERLGLPPFYFVYRHLVFLIPSLLIMVVIAVAGRKTLWRIASLSLVVTLFLMLLTVFFGVEIKGATRWIHLFGFSLQPSEFVKPAFAVTSAWLIARQKSQKNFPGAPLATGLYAVALSLLILQPDLGMSVVLSAIWGTQIFLAGLPLIWVAGLGCLGALGIFGAYVFFPHVTSRIDRFLDPASGDNFQVRKSLDAFSNGGLLGTGPAHGQVKMTLPDAHADFIFSVAGEEFGLIAALFIVLVFCFIILRSIVRIMNSEDLFIVLGVAGLLTQFALQSLVHMGSSLQLLPAKGMTLPFISYGGSSLLALGFAMGMLLALTRKRVEISAANTWRGWSGKDEMAGESYG